MVQYTDPFLVFDMIDIIAVNYMTIVNPEKYTWGEYIFDFF